MRPAPPKSRGLRVGVILADTVIDERTLCAPATFSIGRSLRNTIAVPLPELPRSWPLLTMTADGVLVRLGDDMDIRISHGGTVLARADLAAGATRHRDHVAFVVRPGSYGKILLGELRVLFQEVTLPAVAPRPMLPRSVRGRLIDRIDRRVAAFAAVSIIGHAGVVTAAHLHDAQRDGIVDRAVQTSYVPETLMIIDAADLAYLDPPAPISNQPSTPQPPAVEARPATLVVTGAPRPTPGTPRPRNPPTELPGDATRYADQLFADAGGGTRTGELARRKPGSDLGKQLDEIKDSDATASLGSDEVRVRDSGGPRIGTVTDPVTGTPTEVTTIDRDAKEATPPGRIETFPPTRVAGGANVSGIIRKIGSTYMPGLQRCYKKALGSDAGLSGKVTLSFTVTERGATVDGSARGFDAAIESCIAQQMQKWTFTPVVDSDGDATDVDLTMALQMTPT